MDKNHTADCWELVHRWISQSPTYDNPQGLTNVWTDIKCHMQEIGFKVEQIDNPNAPHRPLLICRRSGGEAGSPRVGFFGHYDVEPVRDESAWDTPPWQLTLKDERWYGRGVGDNLLPLAQRLVLFRKEFFNTDICYVLQGEEEMFGPFAHSVLPSLNLGGIDLWVEETGYFYRDGKQRILTLNADHKLKVLISQLMHLAHQDERDVKVSNRTLNKSLGGKRCPFHEHLLGQIPYLAIGPNDDDCAIHKNNESMDPSLLELSRRQLIAIAQSYCNV